MAWEQVDPASIQRTFDDISFREEHTWEDVELECSLVRDLLVADCDELVLYTYILPVHYTGTLSIILQYTILRHLALRRRLCSLVDTRKSSTMTAQWCSNSAARCNRRGARDPIQQLTSP